METKACNRCHEMKPLSSFDKGVSCKNGYRPECKICRAKARNKGKPTPLPRDEVLRRANDCAVRHKYGINMTEYKRRRKAQGDRCAICGKHDTRIGQVGLHLDHDHITGKLREFLCIRCNTRLGCVEDHEWYEKALAYLRRHSS
jgi:hypothetical protein